MPRPGRRRHRTRSCGRQARTVDSAPAAISNTPQTDPINGGTCALEANGNSQSLWFNQREHYQTGVYVDTIVASGTPGGSWTFSCNGTTDNSIAQYTDGRLNYQFSLGAICATPAGMA